MRIRIRISKGFFGGFTRALDLSGEKKWADFSNEEIRDRDALRSDWENVGENIKRGINEFRGKTESFRRI